MNLQTAQTIAARPVDSFPVRLHWHVNTVRDLLAKHRQYGQLSTRQESFLDSLCQQIADAANEAESRHVGTIGAAYNVDGRVVNVTGFESAYGYCTITVIKDSRGNILVFKGVSLGAKRGDRLQCRGTVKSHDRYKGVAQTRLNRPRNVMVSDASEPIALVAEPVPAEQRREFPRLAYQAPQEVPELDESDRFDAQEFNF